MLSTANRICSVLVSAVILFGVHTSLAPLTAYAEDNVSVTLQTSHSSAEFEFEELRKC